MGVIGRQTIAQPSTPKRRRDSASQSPWRSGSSASRNIDAGDRARRCGSRATIPEEPIREIRACHRNRRNRAALRAGRAVNGAPGGRYTSSHSLRTSNAASSAAGAPSNTIRPCPIT